MIALRERIGHVGGRYGNDYWEVSAWDGRRRVGHVRGTRGIYDGEDVIDVLQSELDPAYKRTGVGKAMYERFAEFACAQSGVVAIVSRGFQRSSEAERVWRSMERRGIARRVRRGAVGDDFAVVCED